VTFQERDTVDSRGIRKKKKNKVQSTFKIENDEVSFSIASFSRNQVLTIDPEVQWATYVGGSGGDYMSPHTAVDADGNIIIRGLTSSVNFPVTTTATQTTINGGSDAFVAKFTRSGQRLWATYYGGSGSDAIVDWAGAAFDNSGNVYIIGST